jgi:hypothetical protein
MTIEKHGDLIIVLGIIAMFILVAMMFYFGAIVTGFEWEQGWKFYCSNLLFGDNSTEGYVLEKVKHCQ